MHQAHFIFLLGRSRKDPYTPPTEEISADRRGTGEKIVSDNSKCIRTSEGGRGLTSYFLCGGGKHVFWDDPFSITCKTHSIDVYTSLITFTFICLLE